MMLALLGPLGIIALALKRRRNAVERLVLIALFTLAGTVALTGCGSGVSGNGGASNIPSGSQPVTFTATVNGVTQLVVVIANIQ